MKLIQEYLTMAAYKVKRFSGVFYDAKEMWANIAPNRTCKQLANTLGNSPSTISRWIRLGVAPKEVLEHFNYKVYRPVGLVKDIERAKRTGIVNPTVKNIPINGSLYIVYADESTYKVLEAFCTSLGINLQKVL